MNASLPALSVLFAVLATAVPWGLPGDATFILPMVVVMMVFCWRALPDTVFPPYLALLLGLLTDMMSGGPLGFWALMALIGASVGGRTASLADSQDRNRLWLVWAGVALLIGVLSWLLGSAYFLRWIDPWPIAFGALASILLFPVVLRLLIWIKRGRLRPETLPGFVVKPRDYALRLRHRFSRRAVLIGAAQTGLFGLLLWRLRRLQILESLGIPAAFRRQPHHHASRRAGARFDLRPLGPDGGRGSGEFPRHRHPGLLRGPGRNARRHFRDRSRLGRRQGSRHAGGAPPERILPRPRHRRSDLAAIHLARACLPRSCKGVRTDRATYRRYSPRPQHGPCGRLCRSGRQRQRSTSTR